MPYTSTMESSKSNDGVKGGSSTSNTIVSSTAVGSALNAKRVDPKRMNGTGCAKNSVSSTSSCCSNNNNSSSQKSIGTNQAKEVGQETSNNKKKSSAVEKGKKNSGKEAKQKICAAKDTKKAKNCGKITTTCQQKSGDCKKKGSSRESSPVKKKGSEGSGGSKKSKVSEGKGNGKMNKGKSKKGTNVEQKGKVSKTSSSKHNKQLAAKKALKALKNMFGFWKGPRLRRMASLNAQAKVHILYENEARSVCSDSDTNDKDATSKKASAGVGAAKSGGQKRSAESDSTEKQTPKKRCKVDPTVVREVITCRRMASLNAQAILAASYSPDRPRKQVKVEMESGKKTEESGSDKSKKAAGNAKNGDGKVAKCNNKKKECKTKQMDKEKEKEREKEVGERQQSEKEKEKSVFTDTRNEKEKEKEREVMEKKKEDTSEVTITGVYINPNASICISRIHTFKQSQTFSPPPSPPLSQGQASVHLTSTPHLMASGVLHTATHLPTGIYSFSNSVMSSSSSQTYPLNGLPNTISNLPVVNVALPRHYGNAFALPHYGPSSPITYASGYYQPAGPLIQTLTTDPCLIHKPVPYHPHLQPASPTLYSQDQCHPTSQQTIQYDPHPTPPYSTQSCAQSKCAAVQPMPPSAGQFSQDRCNSHPSPQEGFFPEHCPTDGGGRQPFQHMQDTFQASAVNFKSQFSDSKACSPAPTLHIQPKEERVADEEPPLKPPMLIPIKSLCALNPKQSPPKCLLTSENVMKCRKSEEKESIMKKEGRKVMKRNRTGGGSNFGAKMDCRRLRQEVNSLWQHKLDRLPRGRIKLLRSDVSVLKQRRRLDTSTTSSASSESARRECITKAARALLKKPHGPVLRVRSNNISINKRDDVKNKNREQHRISSKHARNSVMVKNDKYMGVPSYLRPVVKLKMLKRMPRYSNGWTWEGDSVRQLVQFNNDDPPIMRTCYPAMRHIEGDIIRIRDCVLLKSGPRKNDLPFVAKIAALWENPDDGEMMLSLLWYYRPEHTEFGRKPYHMEDEIFASKHKDINSVACIEDKCYVLTFNEYCRYRRRVRFLEENLRLNTSVVPDPEEGYLRKDRQPLGYVSPDMVFFCRKVYDFRQKRILKNPS